MSRRAAGAKPAGAWPALRMWRSTSFFTQVYDATKYLLHHRNQVLAGLG
jgi:hypothetical protein